MSELDDLGRTKSVGVGLREGEINAFDAIASELGVSRNALMAWALRRFLREHREGVVNIPIEKETRRTLGDP